MAAMLKRRRNALHVHKCHQRKSSLLLLTVLVALSSYIEQVDSYPASMILESDAWPTFPRRNVAALARDGYIRHRDSDKRSISTLAKNGQLPTLRAPYDRDDGQQQDSDGSEEKRNIQALARDGYRFSKTPHNDDKRTLSSLARNGYVHKRDPNDQLEYYYPFYQNQVPPLSELDGPIDYRELYDYQQSVNPDMFPPLDQVFKRSEPAMMHDSSAYSNWFYKRAESGMPMHGLYRAGVRPKRYILSLPDYLDWNDMNPPEDDDPQENDKRSVDDDINPRNKFQKRHIGSLARLGLLPSFRSPGGRYSRSGRARLLEPSQEMYRKHSYDQDFGTRQYIPATEDDTEAYTDDADVPPPPVSSHSHPTGRILNRPLNNDLPAFSFTPSPSYPSPPLLPSPKHDPTSKNRWHSNSKEVPKVYYFKSSKTPYQRSGSGKRYFVLPAADQRMLRESYPNSSLPSRWKNQ